MRSSILVRSASSNAWRSTLKASLATYLREGAVELLFELFLQCNGADERVFGAGVANFSADFMVEFRYNSHAIHCNLLISREAVLVKFENMPTPEKDGASFNDWLVRARNNIQRELLRLQKLIRPPTKDGEIPRFSRRDSIPIFLDLLVGVGFSLWRAVFQAGKYSDRNDKIEKARIFLDEIIRNNAALYSTELNSWSFGYYILNARLRLKELQACVARSERTVELHEAMDALGDSAVPDIWDAPGDWVRCFHAMRAYLDFMEEELPQHLRLSPSTSTSPRA
jgi:hypothetical protein